MAKVYEGNVSHYGGVEGIVFRFREDEKDEKGNEVYKPNLDLAFEIYKAFRDKKVKVTIERVKE